MERRAKVILLLVICLCLLWSPKINATSPGIVINSFRVASPDKATNEYVELYNPSSTPVSITSWRLTKRTASGTESSLVSAFPSAEIRPGESLVVGHADSTESVQLRYTTTSVSLAQDNTITLYNAAKTAVDTVGFGKATIYEGKPITEAGTDIWTRTKGADTQNNLADFKKASGPARDYSGICLSEIYPAPTEGEEWIEIYNSEMTKDIGGLVIADKVGAIKKYTVPEGTIIGEGQYLVIKKGATKITLNDDGDGVVLIDATGKVFDDSGPSFGKAEKGASYANDGSSWRWTEFPTPGAPNKFGATSSTIKSVKKSALSTSTASGSTKGSLPSGSVLGATDGAEDQLFAARSGKITVSDRFFGAALAVLAGVAALVYTGYVNREKLVAAYIKERKGYARSWRKLRQKITRR